MSSNLISIICPAFRSASVIGDCIESVLAQTHSDWELLIAEDCSPDNTREVIASWALKDPRVRLIALPTNGGPALARNAAIAEAKGRWLAFLDSDDWWLPQKLERTLAVARAQNAALVYTAYRRVRAEVGEPGHLVTVPNSLSYRQLLGNTAILTSSVVLDRERTGPIQMRKTYYDDFDCWLQILKAGGRAVGLNEDLVRYRLSPASVSRNKANSAREVWRAYRRLEQLSLPLAAWHFTRYAANAMAKYGRY